MCRYSSDTSFVCVKMHQFLSYFFYISYTLVFRGVVKDYCVIYTYIQNEIKFYHSKIFYMFRNNRSSYKKKVMLIFKTFHSTLQIYSFILAFVKSHQDTFVVLMLQILQYGMSSGISCWFLICPRFLWKYRYFNEVCNRFFEIEAQCERQRWTSFWWTLLSFNPCCEV